MSDYPIEDNFRDYISRHMPREGCNIREWEFCVSCSCIRADDCGLVSEIRHDIRSQADTNKTLTAKVAEYERIVEAVRKLTDTPTVYDEDDLLNKIEAALSNAKPSTNVVNFGKVEVSSSDAGLHWVVDFEGAFIDAEMAERAGRAAINELENQQLEEKT